MSTDDPVLASYRDEITTLDAQLLETINRRLEMVRALRRHKEQSGLAFCDPDREAWLVRHLKERTAGRSRRRASRSWPRSCST